MAGLPESCKLRMSSVRGSNAASRAPAVAAMPTMVTVTNTAHAPQYRCTRRSVTGHSPVLRVDEAFLT